MKRFKNTKGILTNKRAMNLGIIIGIAAVVVVILMVLYTKGAFANEMTSNTQEVAGCNSPKLGIVIKGVASAKDEAWVGSIASPDKIDVKEITANGRALRALSDANFDWKVELVDEFTGLPVASDGGNTDLSGGEKDNPFRLTFKLKDKDCDDNVDDFEGTLVYTVTNTGEGFTQTEEAEKVIIKPISFKDGRYIR